MNFSIPALAAGFFFGVIGWSAFSYGRKLELWKPKVIGMLLMVFPYFFPNLWALCAAGIGLLVLLWFHHDE